MVWSRYWRIRSRRLRTEASRIPEKNDRRPVIFVRHGQSKLNVVGAYYAPAAIPGRKLQGKWHRLTFAFVRSLRGHPFTSVARAFSARAFVIATRGKIKRCALRCRGNRCRSFRLISQLTRLTSTFAKPLKFPFHLEQRGWDRESPLTDCSPISLAAVSRARCAPYSSTFAWTVCTAPITPTLSSLFVLLGSHRLRCMDLTHSNCSIGGGDPRNDRQDSNERGGCEEKAQCHPVGTTDR